MSQNTSDTTQYRDTHNKSIVTNDGDEHENEFGQPSDEVDRQENKQKTASQNHPERDFQQIQTRNQKKMNHTSNDSLLTDNDTLIDPQIIRQQEQTQRIK